MVRYTKREIELYEKFVELRLCLEDFDIALYSYIADKTKNKYKKLTKLFDEKHHLADIIRTTKIPRKFFILNKLNGKQK